MMRAFRSTGFVLCCLALAACHRQDPPVQAIQADAGKVVLAKVGDQEITLAAFESELNRRSRGYAAAFGSAEQRLQLLGEMIEFEVLLSRARQAGYDRDPEIRGHINQFLVSRFQEDQLQRYGDANPALSETELQDYYELHRKAFTQPAASRCGIIEFRISSKATPDKRAELRRRAEGVLAEALGTDPAAFTLLVQQHSEDQATRFAGGDSGWMTQATASSRWDEAVIAAAFALTEPGSFGPLVETPEGFYIVRLWERRPGKVQPLSEVKEVIAYQLTRQRQLERETQFREEMRRGITIETNLGFLQRIPSPTQEAQGHPPAVPGG